MFDSIEMGVSKIVLFDGTPPSVDYVLDLKRRSEVFTMVGCVYGSKRDSLMMLTKRVDEFLSDNNLSRLPLQPKLLPIQGKYQIRPNDRVSVYLNELASFLEDNPKLATATGLNGRLLPVSFCITIDAVSLGSYGNDELKLRRDLKLLFGDSFNYPIQIKANTVHVSIPNTLNRTVILIIYFDDSKLNEFKRLDVLSRKTTEVIAKERLLGYEIPHR